MRGVAEHRLTSGLVSASPQRDTLRRLPARFFLAPHDHLSRREALPASPAPPVQQAMHAMLNAWSDQRKTEARGFPLKPRRLQVIKSTDMASSGPMDASMLSMGPLADPVRRSSIASRVGAFGSNPYEGRLRPQSAQSGACGGGVRGPLYPYIRTRPSSAVLASSLPQS